ncbi:MAG: sarcosine oxidase subunit gamma [Roseibium sp.]|uniref:sarcosine oxidase subunit gamma n=1 Tax=Roseibium sp. TaxID=1936156 RepID=UPI003D9C4A03
MPDYRLTQSVPGSDTGETRFSIKDYTLEVVPMLALASVAARSGSEAGVAANLARTFGTEMPPPGAFLRGTEHTVFWIGRHQWMIAADHETHEHLATELKTELGGSASVTEQNDGWICLDVTGPELPRVFERLMHADADALSVGSALRTVIEHIGCFILCLETDRHYRLFAGRSYGRSLFHALREGLRTTAALRD